jgi:hypothetical protein
LFSINHTQETNLVIGALNSPAQRFIDKWGVTHIKAGSENTVETITLSPDNE